MNYLFILIPLGILIAMDFWKMLDRAYKQGAKDGSDYLIETIVFTFKDHVAIAPVDIEDMRRTLHGAIDRGVLKAKRK